MRDRPAKRIIHALVIIGSGIILSLLVVYTRDRSRPIIAPLGDIATSPPTNKYTWPEDTFYHSKKYGYTLKYPSIFLLIDEQRPEKVYIAEGKNQSVQIFFCI